MFIEEIGREDVVMSETPADPPIFSSDLRAIQETIKLVRPYLNQTHLNDAQAALIGRSLWANLRKEEAKRKSKVFTVGDTVRYSQFGEWHDGTVVTLGVGGFMVEIEDTETYKRVWRNTNFHEIRHA